MKSVHHQLQVCTLRNTPDKPIHCIVWAKEMLFPLLFGAPEASDLNETIGGEAAANRLSLLRVGAVVHQVEAASPSAAQPRHKYRQPIGYTSCLALLSLFSAAAEGSGEDGGEAGQADDPSFYQRREGEGSRQYAERVFRCGRPPGFRVFGGHGRPCNDLQQRRSF